MDNYAEKLEAQVLKVGKLAASWESVNNGDSLIASAICTTGLLISWRLEALRSAVGAVGSELARVNDREGDDNG